MVRVRARRSGNVSSSPDTCNTRRTNAGSGLIGSVCSLVVALLGRAIKRLYVEPSTVGLRFSLIAATR